MKTIQELFDPTKQLDRRIESVVTFADNTAESLGKEIKEYVVTDKLRANYNKVIEKIEEGFSDTAKEVGIWVSGFYGSGKSSFAKYLGYSFQQSLLIDGVSFGEKLMSRIQDDALKAFHKTLIQKFNPLVILIDLSTQARAGKVSPVSDIIYYETMKLLGITSCDDPKILEFVLLLKEHGKFDEFCKLIEEKEHKKWTDVQNNKVIANIYAAKYAPSVLPEYFSSKEDFLNLKIDSIENEADRWKRVKKMVKDITNHDKIIYVLDEVGQYVASDINLILNVQGIMQNLKDQFEGDVWVIATAQQTLTEDNPNAKLNSSELYRLNARFPIRVDIEADDIKEIITKRLLGKSTAGKDYLLSQYNANESAIKLATALSSMERSMYIKALDAETFANLYPFLPVHIDILLSLLQKLASRTGGVGLRSVIRLIRDILVDNKLADSTIGELAGPQHFYDVLKVDMEKNADFKEIILSAEKAIQIFSGDKLAVKLCKIIAVMQILDDFALTFENLCALTYSTIGKNVDTAEIRKTLDLIKTTEGLTLNEIEGKFRFMTNVILSIQEERSRINPSDTSKNAILKEVIADMMTPAPSVQVCGSKTVGLGVELTEGRRTEIVHSGNEVKLNIRFTSGPEFPSLHTWTLNNSTKAENAQTLYWVCTLQKDKDVLINEIVRDNEIVKNHSKETNKEVRDYLKAQTDDADAKKRELKRILEEAMNNSEIVFRGNPTVVTKDNYKTESVKPAVETIYSKYALAHVQMPGKCVETLAQYENFDSIPASLNQLGIISTDGSVDVTKQVLAEIKDFISSKGDATGIQILNHFENPPYGWSKDTTRYLVALMLKAGVIILRSQGREFKVFAKQAAEAMKSNVTFNSCGFSINTAERLKPAELVQAINAIKALFNPSGSIIPQNDAIAKVVNQYMIKGPGSLFTKLHQIKPVFVDYKLAGRDRIDRVEAYCTKISETDGSDAPYMLVKDPEFVPSLKYVINIFNAEENASLLKNIKLLSKRIKDAATLGTMSLIEDFNKKVSDIEQAYNDLCSNPEHHTHTSDYQDLCDQFNAEVTTACIHFETEVGKEFAYERDKIKLMPEYSALNESQKAIIDSSLSSLTVSSTASTLDSLLSMKNEYTRIMIDKKFEYIAKRVIKFVEENEEAKRKEEEANAIPNPPSVSAPSTSPAPTATKHYKRLRRKMTTIQQVEDSINTLQEALDKMQAGDSLEIELTD